MLTIPLEKVCYIIDKAREFDALVDPSELDDGTNPSDDREVEILEDTPDNPTQQELVSAIEDLNQDEASELVALAWTGRGDYVRDEWRQAVRAAREAHNGREAAYLTGIPQLGDVLEEGLAELGYSCEDIEMERAPKGPDSEPSETER